MRFIDETRIRVQSGAGGKGISSFRRERFVPFGGPDGGNGGRGGDIILTATSRRTTLMELRGHAIWKAKNGRSGGGRNRTGACADPVRILVPVGTRVHNDETGELLADLTEDGQEWVAAPGGSGGFGNMHYKSSTNRAPRTCTDGWPGEEKRLRLELMLMADVGLLGFPNAGKSTFISRVSAAKPKIANYPFTTLVPSLGVVSVDDERSFVVADIPGLVRGAAQGHGLGHRFLRHVQRTRVLLHLISLGSDEMESPAARYQAIRDELAEFDPELSARQEVLVFTKADLLSEEELESVYAAFREEIGDVSVQVISSVTGQGIRPLVGLLSTRLESMNRMEEADHDTVSP